MGARHARALVDDVLAEAAQRSGYNIDLDYTQGPGMLLRHLALLRRTARLLAAKATLQARSGDIEGAMGTVLIGLKDANHLKDEPIIISQLVRNACEGILIGANGKDIPPAPGGLLLDELAGHIESESYARAMDAERVVFGQWFIERLTGGRYSELTDSLREANMGGVPRLAIVLASPILKRDLVVYMDLSAENSRLLRQPSEVAYRSIVLGPDIMTRVPWYCVLTRMVVPSFQALCKNHVERLARLETCRAGIAVKLYRQKHGNYPEDLGKLVPEFLARPPQDPFTGKSLLYRTSDQGFVLYSVGPDLKDDGGKRKPAVSSGAKPTDFDVVWSTGT